MSVSHTWEYRFAFRVTEAKDVPIEFRDELERLSSLFGTRLVGYFIPTVNREGAPEWVVIPPRLIVLFDSNLLILSLEMESSHVASLVVERDELVGFGLASFLLDSWMTIYFGSDGLLSIQIRFPIQSCQESEEFALWLHRWGFTETEGESPVAMPSKLPLGTPHQFRHFLIGHPELGQPMMGFLQSCGFVKGQKWSDWPNRLFVKTASGLVVQCDQYMYHASRWGVDATYFGNRSLLSVEWIDGFGSSENVICVRLKVKSEVAALDWPVPAKYKTQAIRWTHEVNAALSTCRIE
jgi:hypothetical protein